MGVASLLRFIKTGKIYRIVMLASPSSQTLQSRPLIDLKRLLHSFFKLACLRL